MDTETGIILGNHIDDLDVEDVENFYGLEIIDINTLEPEKQPLSSMAPSIFVKDDEYIPSANHH